MIITEPGVYSIPEVEYHIDLVPGGSLSSTTARALLPPSCPAIANYRRTHPEYKQAYDIGSAVHELVLRSGVELVEVDAADWKKPATRDQRDEARQRGAVALLSKDMREAEAMAKAVHDHPLAGPLFAPGTGQPEQSVFWVDQRTGQWCRAMLDWFPAYDFGRPIAVDLKTTDEASPQKIRRSVADYGYYQQQAWYLDALESVGHEDPAFLFVFVSKKPPYLVTVCQLDDDAVQAGRDRNARALDVWQECRATGVWSGYSDEIETISLPPWALS